jgi:serine/threonine protein phosphatase PrpC
VGCGFFSRSSEENTVRKEISFSFSILFVDFLCFFVLREAFAKNKSPSQAAEELCDLSIRLGSSDNVTIVIVRFHHS